MNYQKFARLYSYSRITRYLKASKGNKKKAQQMYYANARLAQAFQPLISFFEVILRNQLHYAIAKHFGDVQWLINQKNGFMSDPSLTHVVKKKKTGVSSDFFQHALTHPPKVYTVRQSYVTDINNMFTP